MSDANEIIRKYDARELVDKFKVSETKTEDLAQFFADLVRSGKYKRITIFINLAHVERARRARERDDILDSNWWGLLIRILSPELVKRRGRDIFEFKNGVSVTMVAMPGHVRGDNSELMIVDSLDALSLHDINDYAAVHLMRGKDLYNARTKRDRRSAWRGTLELLRNHPENETKPDAETVI